MTSAGRTEAPTSLLDSFAASGPQLLFFTDNPQQGLVKHNIDHPKDASCQAPGLVRNMAPEYRLKVESHLKRKIDLKLLPMMNHLDRNNIAAARLAGLEAELHLTSVQINVRVHFQY